MGKTLKLGGDFLCGKFFSLYPFAGIMENDYFCTIY